MDTKETPTISLPKINKVSRYYYNHREEILEKKRLARLAKKNGSTPATPYVPVEQRRQAIMEHFKKEREAVGGKEDSPSGVEKS